MGIKDDLGKFVDPSNKSDGIDNRRLLKLVWELSRQNTLILLKFKLIWQAADNTDMWKDFLANLELMEESLKTIQAIAESKSIFWQYANYLLDTDLLVNINHVNGQISQLAYGASRSENTKMYYSKSVSCLKNMADICKKLEMAN